MKKKDNTGDLFAWKPSKPNTDVDFKGAGYERPRDHKRLSGQAQRIFSVISDGEWHTLHSLSAACDAPEASVSAALRYFRRDEVGGYDVERRHVKNGLHEYRLANKV